MRFQTTLLFSFFLALTALISPTLAAGDFEAIHVRSNQPFSPPSPNSLNSPQTPIPLIRNIDKRRPHQPPRQHRRRRRPQRDRRQHRQLILNLRVHVSLFFSDRESQCLCWHAKHREHLGSDGRYSGSCGSWCGVRIGFVSRRLRWI